MRGLEEGPVPTRVTAMGKEHSWPKTDYDGGVEPRIELLVVGGVVVHL